MLDFVSFGTTWFSADAWTVILMAGIVLAGLAWYWLDRR